jgi:DNA polymerase-4
MKQTLTTLFLDFNSYFASVEQQAQPHLRGRPVIVVPLDSDHTSAIAASYEAKRLGIKTNTPVWEARAKCRHLACVVARHRLYLDYHDRLIAEIGRHIPILKEESIDELSCALPPSRRGEAEAVALAQRIKQGIAERVGECLTSSVGLSTNRFLAKVATDLKKPDGLVVLYPEDVPVRLGHLSIRELPGIGPNMEFRLRRVGIGTIADLWARSPRELRRAWGSVEGERMWHKLRGEELPDLPPEKRVVGHSHVLDPALRPFDVAELVTRRLLLKAASRLRRYGRYASVMDIAARVEHGPRIGMTVTFAHACDNATLMRALTAGWSRLRLQQPDLPRLKKVSVQLHGLSVARPASLFAAQDRTLRWREKQEQLSLAMDRLNARFGRDAVLQGLVPGSASRFTGTKIAFTRIPLPEEFLE